MEITLRDTEMERKKYKEKMQEIEDLDMDMPQDIQGSVDVGNEHVVELRSRFREQLKILESERI